MWKDEVVEEVRRVRDAQAKRLNHDIDLIIARAKGRQRRSGHPVVSLVECRKTPRKPLVTAGSN
ncbi:MAG: hypothetical protein HY343_05180 [Lentisphaerae bacterium]|nr:hypothetical protein [Lentisphaerota bacterium]